MQPIEHSDEELAAFLGQAVLDQDERVFQKYSAIIYDRYKMQAYKICRYYGLRHADAEDAAQESFVRLFRSAGMYKAGFRFKAWFFKIVMNIIRDKYREMKRLHVADPDSMQDVPSEKSHFSQRAHNDAFLESLLVRLPEKLRETIALKIYGALDSDSISSVLGISARQVRNRLEEAYGLLREMGVENEFDR